MSIPPPRPGRVRLSPPSLRDPTAHCPLPTAGAAPGGAPPDFSDDVSGRSGRSAERARERRDDAALLRVAVGSAVVLAAVLTGYFVTEIVRATCDRPANDTLAAVKGDRR